ncbi:MAG: FAD-dependent oxidoreductase [Phenylobacterium sp.]|uniref:oxidoreductase n=1 Tax=Phenylobacterium sp. TaxID=1871053 RepID=UPI00120B6CE4|nr:FAD-dependent oxidoreductase [Phenylobacterium sp.]TAJ74304.1 MAG: FAD-dependent oxidoreductase [Phenylobacterium sp.]
MLTHVTRPIRIGAVELKNRVVRTAHATGMGPMSEDLIAYHLARGEGGVGLSIIEILSVHPTSPAGLNTFDPQMPGRYEKLVNAVRPTGMRLFQQVWHGGQNSLPLDGSPPWGPSDRPGVLTGVPTIPMTRGMIDEIVAAYADAAAKCVAWGLDGLEIHCAHGYLPAQFLSPAVNTREDEFGGPIENRARFILEIMRAVRAATPPGYPVGVRLAPDETAGGIGAGDVLRVAQWLEAERLVDFVDLSLGNYQSFAKMIGGMHEPAGYELAQNAQVTAKLGAPSLVTGRFRTLEEADQVIRAGQADLVGMTRAHIADPHLVRKSLEGRVDQVRPCIACNQGCVGNLLGPRHRVACVVNPGAGFELRLGDDRLTPAAARRRVVVVGGGPSGLEAARVAALRGHAVVLLEAQPALGGTLRLAARAPTRHGLGDYLGWLESEVYRLGVEVRLSTFADADDVRALAPDAVIVAAGSTPRLDGVQASNPGEPMRGAEDPRVVSSSDLFAEGRGQWGQAAVVVDDVGHYEGVSAAEHLVGQGLAVTYVSRHASFAPGVETALMPEPALQRLSKGDFTLRLRTRAVAFEGRTVSLAPTYLAAAHNRLEIVPADIVVFVSPNRPNRTLYDDLVGGAAMVSVVGDANAPRFLEAAVHEGHRAAAAIA